MPELNANAPMSRNIGTAESVQLAARSNDKVPIDANAAFTPRIAHTPTTETISSVTAIGTLTASSMNSAAMPNRPICKLLTGPLAAAQTGCGGRRLAPSKRVTMVSAMAPLPIGTSQRLSQIGRKVSPERHSSPSMVRFTASTRLQ